MSLGTSQKLLVAAIAAIACAAPAMAQDDLVADGGKVFKKCMACHAVGENARNKIGPVLNDVFGRQAGTAADYKYSKAMIEAGENGLVWTPETFKAYIEAPRDHVKGTKMTFAGLKKDEDREAVTAYLLTFSPDYTPAEDAAE